MEERELEQPTETCGLMMTFEGGIAVKVNLRSTKQKVIEKIQNHLSKGFWRFKRKTQNLIQFETANPEEQEVCMFNVNKVLIAMVKKEFVIGNKIVPASLGSPGVPPQRFDH